MRARSRIAALVISVAGLGVQGTALAARVLVEQPGISVTTQDRLRCGEPLEVRVDAHRPAIFEREATELQRIVDAVRSQLGFECRTIPAIIVSGTLTGMNEEMYHAVAEPRNDWRLVAQSSLRTGSRMVAGTDRADAINAQLVPTATFLIAGLSVGMSVEEAMIAVKSNLGVDARYNPRRQELQVRERGCPPDYDWSIRATDPMPGWRCLDASFAAGGADPWLTEAMLAQVVDRDQRNAIIESLVARYGLPSLQYNDTPARTRLAWGTRIDSRGTPDQDLQANWPLTADVEGSNERTILVLRLFAAAAPSYQFRF
jgi:hypothetical protein